ncbi:hypothetical protein LCGC14_1435580, partial [marine sediment metagenome]
ELTMHLGSEITDVGTTADDGNKSAFIKYEDSAGESQQWQGEYVLVATGRRNNIKQLGVENLGVELDDKNRPKDLSKKTGQIGDLNVYIVGDANANIPLLHVASVACYPCETATMPCCRSRTGLRYMDLRWRSVTPMPSKMTR